MPRSFDQSCNNYANPHLATKSLCEAGEVVARVLVALHQANNSSARKHSAKEPLSCGAGGAIAYVLAEQLAEAWHDRRQAELVLRPVLGPALRRARAGISAAEFGACSAPDRG